MQLKADHYGVNVSNIDRSIKFYCRTLGFELADRFPADDEKQGKLVGVPNASAELAFVECDDFEIELIQYSHPPNNRIYDETRMHDVGVTHLCFNVDNVDEWYDSLVDDVEFESEPLVLDGEIKIAYFYDPDGNQLELLEENIEDS